jgi:hypothetical protein
MTHKTPSLGRIFAISVAALSAVWLAGMLYLDFTYDMFPRVLIGGCKILIAGYAVLALLVVLIALVKRISRRDREVRAA